MNAQQNVDSTHKPHSKSRPECQVAIIGAGPYGLAAAAHLRAAKIETRVFGEPMEFWAKQMPEGMIVRSIWEACHISDPNRALTMDGYVAATGVVIPQPVPLADFISYGLWFQQQVVPDVDPRRIVKVERAGNGFRLGLDDGEFFHAQRVVVATGISKFPRRPPIFDGFHSDLVSHTSEHRTLGQFRKMKVAVVGGGQSALETAALLHEAGAEVEVIARQTKINWLDQSRKARWLRSESNPFRRILYPPTDVGPPGLNWIVATPSLFRRLPRETQEWVAYRSTRPAGSGWLVPRLRTVPIRTGLSVAAAAAAGDRIILKLDDGGERSVDHVMLATGYWVDISRCGFFTPELLGEVEVVDGYPELRAGLESSVPGLHFLGASAVRSFGPVNRFVSGTHSQGARWPAASSPARGGMELRAPPQMPAPGAETWDDEWQLSRKTALRSGPDCAGGDPVLAGHAGPFRSHRCRARSPGALSPASARIARRAVYSGQVSHDG